MIDKTEVNPGFHKQFRLDRFSETDQQILRKLSRYWYLTSSGEEIQVAQSKYNFFLMRAPIEFAEMFNIEREIVCILSNYDSFESRSLDIFEEVFKKLPRKRVETVCGVLISKSDHVEQKVESLLKSDPEYPVIIPFAYSELQKETEGSLYQNRFRKHFYSRDLFSFLSPLKKDTYFFGRNNLINEISSRFQSGEHTSLFGLRKSGKTSIIYALQRKLEVNKEISLSIDCESPSIHMLRWNELLEKLVTKYHETKQSKFKLVTENRYTEKLAAESFEQDMLNIYSSKKAQRILIVFDEIERLTPHTASSEHWRENYDFIYFWQTLRGFYQKHPEIYTYMLVGTNPSCVEAHTLCGHENPLFASIPSQYIPNFSIEQVKEMVTKLGTYMGLVFDDYICNRLTDDFGGHPFLIRQMCSLLNSKSPKIRPFIIDKSLYNSSLDDFTQVSREYLDMMIGVLKSWYPNEHQMLVMLANNDIELFEGLAKDNVSYTRHLRGYGLINKGVENHTFNLEIIAKYLKENHAHEKMNLSNDEKISEISSRRNRIEKGLRTLIRNTLRMNIGLIKAKTAVLASVPEGRREKLNALEFNQILEPTNSPLFFLDLKSLFNKEWEHFKNITDIEKNKFLFMLDDINSFGRPDAHSKTIDDDEFTQLRLHFKKIEAILDEFGY